MELPLRGAGVTADEVQAIIDDARERIIQTVCDAVERMIQDANER